VEEIVSKGQGEAKKKEDAEFVKREISVRGPPSKKEKKRG